MSPKTNSIALIDLDCQLSSEHRERRISPFRRVGRQSLLERTVRRLSESSLLDAIVIVGSDEHAAGLAQSGTQPAEWISTTASSSVARAWQAAKQMKAEWVVSVAPTSVFVDPILIDRLLAVAWGNPQSDMVGFASTVNPSLCVQGAGLAGEACHRRVLERLLRDPAFDKDNRSLSQLVDSLPELFHKHFIPLPAVLEHTDLRFVLETEHDLDKAVMILEATGEDTDYRDLVHLARHFTATRKQAV